MRLVLNFVPRLRVASQFVPGRLGDVFQGPSDLFLSFRVNTCHASFLSFYLALTLWLLRVGLPEPCAERTTWLLP